MSISKTPVFLFCMVLLSNCAQEPQKQQTITKEPHQNNKLPLFSLEDYLTEGATLEHYVDSIYSSLDDKALVAQLIMPAVGRYGQTLETINGLIKDQLMLSNHLVHLKAKSFHLELFLKSYLLL